MAHRVGHFFAPLDKLIAVQAVFMDNCGVFPTAPIL
jgi:hypothetical protein